MPESRPKLQHNKSTCTRDGPDLPRLHRLARPRAWLVQQGSQFFKLLAETAQAPEVTPHRPSALQAAPPTEPTNLARKWTSRQSTEGVTPCRRLRGCESLDSGSLFPRPEIVHVRRRSQRRPTASRRDGATRHRNEQGGQDEGTESSRDASVGVPAPCRKPAAWSTWTRQSLRQSAKPMRNNSESGPR